jgi:hypothetical protein
MKAFGRKTASVLLTGAFVLIGAACSDSGGGGGGTPQITTFVGVASSGDGTTSGSISITVQTTTLAPPTATGPSVRAPANATGTLVMGGSTSLTGSYDPDTDILALSGGGYTFGGGFDGVDRLEGLWSGPGNTSGTFVTSLSTNAVAFCGTYDADDQSDSGTFSFVIAGTVVRGEAYSSVDQTPIALDGVVNGNAITIYFPGTTTPLATGTRSGNNVSGTYDDGQGGTGTWSGAVCQ